MVPIWRDYYVTLTPPTGESSILYRVSNLETGDVLFQGRAFPRPGENACRVRLNDIVAPHLSALTQFPGGAEDFGQIYVASEWWDNTDWNEHEGMTFLRDWSYDPAVSPYDVLQRPVVPHVVTGQYLFFNQLDADPDTELDMYPSGDTYVGIVPSGPVYIEDVTFKHVCARFVLYYLNALGGWDALPVEGKTDITDGVARVLAEQVYDNRTPSARGTVDHLNTLTRQYTFHTQPLTAAQSLRMHHLLNSPQVYVHDLQEGRVSPLVLTNSATQHKDGTALYVYDITAQLAQERIRR